ncbi:DUF1127 domain-containing protein [Falsihalocynthiibacter arcticus]|uniref:YjiS-like domain-containing protein n=1 Tax=Falsihalocynthiibacter arcticus TaxID=1579316 RepID=A0A126V230_9RHOB|nr:DUF1127 domain-containing protein [Falsihalocynthiibacter arcticus]AML52005.1 hypothetical protein RC74_12645 [Falsihalocynthiibacter arcticus]
MHPYILNRNHLARRANAAVVDPHGAPVRDGILRRWARSAIQNWKRRKMIAVLQAMDDRLLRDIGIYRNDIERVVDGFDERELGMVPFAPKQIARVEDQSTLRQAA